MEKLVYWFERVIGFLTNIFINVAWIVFVIGCFAAVFGWHIGYFGIGCVAGACSLLAAGLIYVIGGSIYESLVVMWALKIQRDFGFRIFF